VFLLWQLLCFRIGNFRVSNMETHGSVDAGQASEALASVRDVRARVAWSGYPAWYWPTTGAALGALCFTTLLSGWPAVAVSAGLALLLVMAARAACRARGVCEGWTRGAMTRREAVVLYGPAAVVILANAVIFKVAPSSWPWAPAAAAVLMFLLFTGTGLTLSTRAARR
jgi:hypothetical protein